MDPSTRIVIRNLAMLLVTGAVMMAALLALFELAFWALK